MDPHILDLLCDPETHAPLASSPGQLDNQANGRCYPVRSGIPVFVSEATGLNRKYQTMYDKLAPGYDVAERLYHFFTRKKSYRLEYIPELEIQPGDRVLEVSVGTGANLAFLPRDIVFFGLDLSPGMLRKCHSKLHRLPFPAALFQGEAEHLPFRSEAFDCVYHVGGINFFNDKAAAIAEMIRVAKPGSKIVIVDETEKVVREQYQKNPTTRRYFAGVDGEVSCPVDLVPVEMSDIHARQIAQGKLYCLTFRKPFSAAGSPLPSGSLTRPQPDASPHSVE